MAAPEWTHSGAGEGTRLADALKLDDREPASWESGCVSTQLRRHACSERRTRGLQFLALQWRYKSDCWSKDDAECGDGERRRRRRTVAAADDPEADPSRAEAKRAALMTQLMQLRRQALASLFERTYTAVQVAHGQVTELMMPHIAAAARSWSGPRSAVQYGRKRGEGMTWLRVRSVEGALEMSRWLEQVYTLRLQALRSWRDALGEDGARALAYTVAGAYNAPESELDALRYVVSLSLAATEANAEILRKRQPDGELTLQDAAWLQDYHDGHSATVAMLNSAHALMARYRMEPLRYFVVAAEAVLDGMLTAMRSNQSAFIQRLEWATEAAASQGAAAGDQASARAALPPLVQRLHLTGDDEYGTRLLALAHTPPPPGQPLPRFVLARPAEKGPSK